VSSLPRVRSIASTLAVQIKRPTLFSHNMPTFFNFICINSSPSRSTIQQVCLGQYDYAVFIYISSHQNFFESPTLCIFFSLDLILNVQHEFLAFFVTILSNSQSGCPGHTLFVVLSTFHKSIILVRVQDQAQAIAERGKLSPMFVITNPSITDLISRLMVRK
jgi:hypothetical protein